MSFFVFLGSQNVQYQMGEKYTNSWIRLTKKMFRFVTNSINILLSQTINFWTAEDMKWPLKFGKDQQIVTAFDMF